MQNHGDNQIHPTAIIGVGVKLGSGNIIGPFVQIFKNCEIGDRNYIGVGSIIGAYPEEKSIDHLNSDTINKLKGVVIGNDVVIREYVQVHQGAHIPTTIGDRSFLMNQTYIAHDCQVGVDSVLASSVLLAGNVVIGPGANLGMGATVHQGVVVGNLSMVGMGSAVTRDVPNFMKVYGVPARIHGANEIGMDRAGMLTEEIDAAREVASRLKVCS